MGLDLASTRNKYIDEVRQNIILQSTDQHIYFSQVKTAIPHTEKDAQATVVKPDLETSRDRGISILSLNEQRIEMLRCLTPSLP